ILLDLLFVLFFFFSSRRRHTISKRDWSSDVCSSDLLTSLFSVVLHNLWSISIAVTKLHLCTNSRVKCPFPEPISKILSCSFKLIFVIILFILRFEVIKFCLSFIFFLFFIIIFFLYFFCFLYFFLIR